jgi:pimeloyl-ACP methyl ester carboxylesterase
MSVFVLVHGAYHGAWCYSKVVPFLEAAGHKAVAVDLPGHGDNIVPRDQITLDNYVRHVCDVVDAQDEPVILVGHSMGGLTISQVSEDRADKVKMAVYLTALMPLDGESRNDVSKRVNEEARIAEARIPTEDGLANTCSAHLLKGLFYNDCSDADIAFAKANLVPQAFQPMGQKLRLSEARYGSVPRVFIECLQDGALSIRMQRAMYTAAKVDKVVTMDTSHSPFFSAPEALAGHLMAL